MANSITADEIQEQFRRQYQPCTSKKFRSAALLELVADVNLAVLKQSSTEKW